MFSNPREEGISGRGGIVEKLRGEVFNGTGCGNTRATGRAGKKRYGFWVGKYYKQSHRVVCKIHPRGLAKIVQRWAESRALKPDSLD